MATPVDPKVYYGYLFQANKQPTKVLDLLLRGIANYIVSCRGGAGDELARGGFRMLTVYRSSQWATSTTELSALRSWQASTRLSAETMIVCPPLRNFGAKLIFSSYCSALCQRTASLDLLDLCIHRLPAYPPAYQQRLRPPFYTNAH